MKHLHLLKQHQLKATPQRLAIIELMDDAGHISIDDLFSAIRKKFSSISLATLYKNVHTMMDVSLIREVKIPGHKTKYEIEKESHAHIMCKCCGELKDLEINPESIFETSIRLSRYQPQELSVVISGVCPTCQSR